MLRGELGQEPFRVYKRTVFADLLYERITKDPFLEPQEAQVWLRVGNEFESAFVPLYIVDEEKNTVRAALAGDRQGRILVSFPPTNFGQSQFSSSFEDLERIAVSSFYANR